MAFGAICHPRHHTFFRRPRADNNIGNPFKLCDNLLVKRYKKCMGLSICRQYHGMLRMLFTNIVKRNAILPQTLCVVVLLSVNGALILAF